jgi:hypothetical protein
VIECIIQVIGSSCFTGAKIASILVAESLKGGQMYRCLLPSFLMVGALLVLFAGAFGNLTSLPKLTARWVAHVANTAPQRATPPTNDIGRTPPAAALAPTASDDQQSRAPTLDTLKQQAAELQAQITQCSRGLASLQSNEDPMHREFDALHQQRQAEAAAVAQLEAQQRQLATASANQPDPAALQKQVTTLQAQITQRSQELAGLRSGEDQAQRDLDKLHQQRQTEESAVAQLEAQQRQMAAAQAKQPSTEALQQQVTGLQAQITQRSQELAALRSSEDRARQDLETLRQQLQTEEAAVSRLQTQQRRIAAVAPPETIVRPQPTAEPTFAPRDNTAVQTALARLRAGQQSPSQPAQPASVASQRATTQPVLLPSPRDDLVTARELLVSGRAADARQLLMKAQAQSALRPVTPDQPLATGGNATATHIGEAIRFPDAGNTGYALQSINLAMDDTIGGTRPLPGCPRQPSPGSGYPVRPGY